MSEANQSSSSSGNDDETDLPSAAADCSGSTVVFAGDPSRVSAGFALALRLMGLDVPLPEPCDQSGQDD